MGAKSVTGKGAGSADGQGRGSGHFAINSSNVFGFSEVSKKVTELTNQVNELTDQVVEIGGAVSPPNTIFVSSDSLYKEIADAVDSITDSSETNRYVITVAPGIYVEREIKVPSFVFVQGEHIDSVVVQADGNHTVFSLHNRSGIQDLTISSGSIGVYLYDVGNFCVIHKTSIRNCDIGILHESDIVDSYSFLEYVDFLDCNINIKSTNLGSNVSSVTIENLYLEYSDTNPDNAIIVDGDQSEVIVMSSECMGADITGNAFLVTNGGYLVLTSSRIHAFNRGIYADTNGVNPYIKMSDVDFRENNINFEIANTTASGNFTGYSLHELSIVNKANNFFITNKDERRITVAKKGGDYNSIKDAMESITDNSYELRYNIMVGPGEYTEDTIVMKDYVTISGDEARSTIIQLNPEAPDETNLIENPPTVNTTIRKVLLRDATGAAFKYYGGVSSLEQVRFGSNKYCVDASGVYGDVQNSLNCNNCSCSKNSEIDLVFKFSDDGEHKLSAVISHFTTNDSAIKMKNVAEIGIVSGSASGQNTEVEFVGCSLLGDGTGTAIKVADGADLHIIACQIVDFDIGVHAPQEGNGPEIEIVGSLIYDNVSYDLLLSHPLATGVVSVTCDTSKVEIVDTATTKISALIQDHANGSLVVSGDYYQGDNFANVTNVTETITKEPTLGRMSGGETTSVSGRTVSVAAGTGYVLLGTSPNETVKYVIWNQATIEIPANSNKNIYVGSTGNISYKDAFVNIYSEIFLSRIVTDATSIVMLVDTYRDAIAAGTKYDRLFRLYLGPVYRSGSIASVVSGTKIKVIAGDYAFSTKIFSPSGANPITFSTWYPNGASWYVITTGLTDVPNTQYYKESEDALADLDTGHYVKHALYTYGEGINEKYFLVYGQEDFPDLIAAQAGSLPSSPTPLTVSAVLIGAVIVQKGQNIDSIIDQRPTLITRAGSITATTLHGNLQGLDADDHKQYAFADGSGRLGGPTFSNDVDLGTHNLLTSGLVDGVDVSAHHIRHLPGSGTDALHTAAPNSNLSVSSTNSEGVQASFARSDHAHAITTASANTVSTIVSRDASGNFSASRVTANLTGNVTGNADTATNFTGNMVGDVTGTQENTVVVQVGDSQASDIHTAELLANAATNANTANTIVKRDSSGNFTASTITANIIGNASGTSTNITGIATIANGGTNSSTILNNNRIIVSNSGSIVEAAAITGNKAIITNSNGIPIASLTTDTEIGYVNGVTSAIQTQINTKAASSSLTSHTESTSNPHDTTLEQARSQGNQISGNIDANGYTMINVAYPQNPGDICNKQYADETASGLNIKDPAQVATTTNLVATYNAISKTLTANANARLVIDAINVLATNRILVKDQTEKKQNGIYTVTEIGANDSLWILTRATDFDVSAEITNGSFVLVTDGFVNKNAGFVLTTMPPITLDSTNISWSQFSKTSDITTGSGLALNGTAFDVQVDDVTITISNNELLIKNSGIGDTQLNKANISLSGFAVPTADISWNSKKITNLSAPNDDNDAARKTDVGAVQTNLTNHIGTGGASHAEVTISVDGFMIAADKVKLDAATNVNTVSTIVKRDASGNFSAGIITAALTGNATTATTTANFSGSLVGDVTGTQNATVVSTVGGQTATAVATAATSVAASTNTNTVSTIVKRDSSGNFSAGIISAALSGNVTGNLTGDVTGNISGTAASFTNSLIGDVIGTQGATVVSNVGGMTAANVATGATAANNATSTNTVGKIVIRDSNGDFASRNITASSFIGPVTGNITGNVTGTASGNVPYTGAVGNVDLGTNTITAGGFIGPITVSYFYGHMYASGISQAVNITVAGTMVRIPGSLTGGISNGFTFQNNRELLCVNAGTYSVNWNISAVGSGNNEQIRGSFMVDGTAKTTAVGAAVSTTSTRPVCVSGTATVTLTANQIVSLCVTNATTSTAVTVQQANLSITKVG